MWNLLRLPFAALFAAGIVFFWGIFSWMKFDWHSTTIHQFSDEAAVGKVLRENASTSGMYVLPQMEPQHGIEDPTANEAYQIKKSAGPYFFGAVRPGELGSESSMERLQVIHLISVFISAVVMGGILWIAGIESYLGRVGFVTLMALFASLVTHVPYWTWFEFSTGHTLASMGDTLVAWTLGGLALAAMIWPEEE